MLLQHPDWSLGDAGRDQLGKSREVLVQPPSVWIRVTTHFLAKPSRLIRTTTKLLRNIRLGNSKLGNFDCCLFLDEIGQRMH